MSTTTYTDLDVTNIVRTHPSGLTNATENGTGLNINASGSNNVPFAAEAAAQLAQCSAITHISFSPNHASPVGPIPNNAQITAIEIRQFATLNYSSNTTATGTNSHLTAESAATIFFTLRAVADLWSTVSSFNINADSNSGPSASVASSVSGAQGIISKVTYDFTTNPNGDFPAGYMSYAQFLAHFSTLGIIADNLAANSTSLPSLGCLMTGTATATLTFTTTIWEMEVTWNEPLAWTISPASLVLPDNIVTITRPDPGVPPDQDTEAIESLIINNERTIVPNDPWVIVWLRFTIKFHLPPDSDDNPLPIKATIRGTTFTGGVPLGTLTVTYADLSGIYTFDEDTHHDQLYDRSNTTLLTTVNVVIPAPFFVTSFFGSSEVDIQHYNGTRMRVTGQGSLKQVFQSLDYVNTEQLGNNTLLTSNNNNPFTLANFIDQEASLRVYMETLDDFMNVSKIVIFSVPLYSGYPQ